MARPKRVTFDPVAAAVAATQRAQEEAAEGTAQELDTGGAPEDEEPAVAVVESSVDTPDPDEASEPVSDAPVGASKSTDAVVKTETAPKRKKAVRAVALDAAAEPDPWELLQAWAAVDSRGQMSPGRKVKSTRWSTQLPEEMQRELKILAAASGENVYSIVERGISTVMELLYAELGMRPPKRD